MNWNMKWIILGVVFVILVMALGRHSGRESREERAAVKANQSLVEQIEEHTAKDRHLRRTGKNNVAPSRSGRTSPSYMGGRQSPAGRTPYRDAPAPTSPPPGQGYYPPPAGSPQGKNDIFPDKTPRLASGQPVWFRGISAFTINAKGEKVPLPNGVYTFANGKSQVVIRDGRKILANR